MNSDGESSAREVTEDMQLGDLGIPSGTNENCTTPVAEKQPSSLPKPVAFVSDSEQELDAMSIVRFHHFLFCLSLIAGWIDGLCGWGGWVCSELRQNYRRKNNPMLTDSLNKHRLRLYAWGFFCVASWNYVFTLYVFSFFFVFAKECISEQIISNQNEGEKRFKLETLKKIALFLPAMLGILGVK